MTDEMNPLKGLLSEFDLASVTGTSSLGAWFLGPKAENQGLLTQLVLQAIQTHCDERRTLYPADPEYLTKEMKRSEEYRISAWEIRDELDSLLERLRGSVPFFSYRYQAHMNWDLTLPSLVGYFAAMLYNQNNVALEGSPVTTLLEASVGKDLCRMLGYSTEGSPSPWGHIACDGTVANIEALWSARNLKYHAIAVARAIEREPVLRKAREMEVERPDGETRRLLDLTPWQLLNLTVDEALALTDRMVSLGVRKQDLSAINRHSLQRMGYERFAAECLGGGVGLPAVLAPVSKHYSWPKATTLLGIGEDNLLPIDLDLDARAKAEHVRELLDGCFEERRPVVTHVVVLGSTEQSAVDPLAEMLRIREDNHRRGLAYSIHADAAWGGYFASLLRSPQEWAGKEPFTPELRMSRYVTEQYEALPRADSISVDPHKAGFVPYPAGGLCYRNKAQRELVAFSAPYVDHADDGPGKGEDDGGVGFYGVEGSKPGAAAAGVYLSHRVISTDQGGYGKLLGKALFNSKRLYAAIMTMASDDDPFVVVPCQRLPAERAHPGDPAKLRAELDFIRERIVGKDNLELHDDQEAMELMKELGSDQVIIAYLFNAKRAGALNTDIRRMNTLNQRIYKALNIHPRVAAQPYSSDAEMPPLMVTASKFDPETYKSEYLGRLRNRLGIGQEQPELPIDYLISTTMDPWVSDTAEGDFTPTLVKGLRDTVIGIIREMECEDDLPIPAQPRPAEAPRPMTTSRAGGSTPS